VRPFVREIVHASKRTPLLLAIVLVVAAGALVPSIQVSGGLEAGGVTIATSYNYSDQFNFVVVAFDGLGQTVSGTAVNVTLTYSNQSGSQATSVGGVTNAQGLWGFSWNHSECQCGIEVKAAQSVLITTLSHPSSLWTPVAGSVYIVPLGLILGRPSFLVAYSGAGGVVPPGTTLSYCAPADNETLPCLPQLLGNVTASPERILLTSIPTYPNSDPVNITLTAYGGRVNETFQVNYGQINQTNPASVQLAPAGLVLRNGVTLLPLFAALGGVLVGFGVYIQEQSEGSLEPVLALPVTRTQIIARRFSVGLLWLALSAAVASTAVFVGAERVASVTLPFTVFVGVFGMIFGVGAAFLALAFLVGSLARSSASSLAVLLVLASVLTLLWSAITVSASSAGTWLDAVGLNPAQAGGALGVSILNLAAGEPPAAFTPQVDPAIGAILLVAWVGASFICAWLRFRYRD